MLASMGTIFCECGYALRKSASLLHCSNKGCSHYLKSFVEPTIQLHEAPPELNISYVINLNLGIITPEDRQL